MRRKPALSAEASRDDSIRTAGRVPITGPLASMSVLENVQMALLERVGMAGQAARPCGVLAYCDLKCVVLAVALANQPALPLMNEPTAGMAPAERVALMQLTA